MQMSTPAPNRVFTAEAWLPGRVWEMFVGHLAFCDCGNTTTTVSSCGRPPSGGKHVTLLLFLAVTWTKPWSPLVVCTAVLEPLASERRPHRRSRSGKTPDPSLRGTGDLWNVQKNGFMISVVRRWSDGTPSRLHSQGGGPLADRRQCLK